MIELLLSVLAILASVIKSKTRLEAENAVLRHQLIVLRRKLGGRVPEPVSRASIFYKVATEQVAIDIDGNEVMMTRWEALARQVHTRALNKNSAASRLMHRMRKRFPGS